MYLTGYEKGVALHSIAKEMMLHRISAEAAAHNVYDISRKFTMMQNGIDGAVADVLLELDISRLVDSRSIEIGNPVPIKDSLKEFAEIPVKYYPEKIYNFDTSGLNRDLFEKTCSTLKPIGSKTMKLTVCGNNYLEYINYSDELYSAKYKKGRAQIVISDMNCHDVTEDINNTLKRYLEKNLPCTDCESVFK